MKSVLVLGAGSDIAIAIARQFAYHQYHLILAGRNLSNLHKIQKDIAIKYNTSVEVVAFDARELNAHKTFIAELKHLPEITVCSFGYLGDQQEAQKNNKEAVEIIETNYTGAVSILNLIADQYADQQKGIIVGISSVAGDRGRQSNYIYGSAKAGFSTYLSGLRNRLFRCNCHVMEVKPGFVATKMTQNLDLPPLLTAKPEDVALKVYKGVKHKKNVIYVLGIWRYIMLIIRNIPEFIFKKLKL